MNISVIVAHPDDAEIWMGGTLLAYNCARAKINIIYPLPVLKIRKSEARKGPFNAIFTSDLEKTLLSLKPSLIFTHWEKDCHYEHRKVFVKVDQIIPELVALRRLSPRIFSFGSYNILGLDGSVFSPVDFVDITDHWEEKKTLIKNHESQNPDLWIRMIEPINRLWGNRCGTQYAEGFIEIPVLGVTRRACKTL